MRPEQVVILIVIILTLVVSGNFIVSEYYSVPKDSLVTNNVEYAQVLFAGIGDGLGLENLCVPRAGEEMEPCLTDNLEKIYLKVREMEAEH